jgi:penicillin-binding protein 2
MFERRLRLILVLMVLPVLAIAARLVHLQVIEAAEYQDAADKMLIKPVRLYPCLRGDIVDSQGVKLAYDSESWSICVHYGILSKDRDHLRALAQQRLKDRGVPRTTENKLREMVQLEQEIDASWHAISRLTGKPIEELEAVRAKRIAEVQRIKELVTERRGIDTIVYEELSVHPIVEGLNQQEQVEAKVQLADYPWVEVLVSHARRYEGGEAVGQLFGTLNEVGEEDQKRDPNSEEELARYLPGDLIGRTGLEKLGEERLRGRRGCEQENLRGELTRPPVQPENGQTMHLTFDLRLQQALYNRLKAAVQANPPSSGGAAVLLDIPTRKVVALVSYPSYDPNISETDRLKLPMEDPLGRPHICRAVKQAYPPGSTVKPMVLASALADGKVGYGTTYNCRGYLLDGYPDRWRCDARWGHGTVDPITAIQKSCNVFFYHVGENMGVERLRTWMSRFGLAQETGIGLEESRGSLPVPKKDMGPGPARLTGIGQGEVGVTPLQSANMVACVASGVWRRATIWEEDPDSRPEVRLPISDEIWRFVRQGMYKVVNEEHGTAYGPLRAKLAGADEYVLLGKTGSAQAPALEFIYTCKFPDGRIQKIKGRTFALVQSRFPEGQKPENMGQEPAAEYPTHGWFVGYITSRDRALESATKGDLNVAIAVIVEYAGHGGVVAAPVARDMLQTLITLHRGGPIETEPSTQPATRGAGGRP